MNILNNLGKMASQAAQKLKDDVVGTQSSTPNPQPPGQSKKPDRDPEIDFYKEKINQLQIQIRTMIEKEAELTQQNSKFKEEIEYVNMAYSTLQNDKNDEVGKLQQKISKLLEKIKSSGPAPQPEPAKLSQLPENLKALLQSNIQPLIQHVMDLLEHKVLEQLGEKVDIEMPSLTIVSQEQIEQIVAAESKRKEYQGTIGELKGILQQQTDREKQTVRSLEEEVHRLTVELETLKQAIQQSNHDAGRIRQKAEQYMLDYAQLKTEIENIDAKRIEIQNLNEQLNKIIDERNQSIAECMSKHEEQKKAQQDQIQKLKNAQIEQRTLLNEVKKQYQTDLDSLKEKFRDATEQCTILQQAKSDIEAQLSSKSTQNVQLQEQISNLKNELTSEIDNLKQTIKNNESTINRLRSIEQEYQSLTQKSQKHQQSINSLQSKLDTLTNMNVQLNSQISDNAVTQRQTSQKIQHLSDQNTAYLKQLEELKARLGEKNRQLHADREAMQQVENNLEQAEQVIRESEQKIKELEEKISEEGRIRQENEQKWAQISKQAEQLRSALQYKLQQLQAELEEKNKVVVSQQMDSTDKIDIKQFNILKQQLESSQTTVTLLQQQSQQLRMSHQKSLKQMHQKLTHTVEHVNNDFEKLQRILGEREEQLDELKQQLREMKNKQVPIVKSVMTAEPPEEKIKASGLPTPVENFNASVQTSELMGFDVATQSSIHNMDVAVQAANEQEELQQAITVLQNKLKTMAEESHSMCQMIQELQKEVTQQRQKNTKLNQLLRNNADHQDKVNQIVKDFQQQVRQLTNQINQLQANSSEKDEALSRLHQKVCQLEEEKVILKKDMENSLTIEADKANREIQNQTRIIQELRQQVSDLRKKIENSIQNEKNLQTQILQLRDQKSQIQKAANQKHQELLEKLAQVDELTQRIQTMQQEFQTQRSSLQQNTSSLEAAMEQKTRRIFQLTSQCSALKSQLTNIQQATRQLNLKAGSLEMSLELRDQQIQGFKAIREELDREKMRLREDYSMENQELIMANKRKLEDSENRISELEGVRDELEGRLLEATEEKEAIVQANNALEAKIEELTHHKDQIQAKLKQTHRNSMKALSQSRHQLEQIKAKKLQLAQSNTRLQLQNRKYEQEMVGLQFIRQAYEKAQQEVQIYSSNQSVYKQNNERLSQQLRQVVEQNNLIANELAKQRSSKAQLEQSNLQISSTIGNLNAQLHETSQKYEQIFKKKLTVQNLQDLGAKWAVAMNKYKELDNQLRVSRDNVSLVQEEWKIKYGNLQDKYNQASKELAESEQIIKDSEIYREMLVKENQDMKDTYEKEIQNLNRRIAEAERTSAANMESAYQQKLQKVLQQEGVKYTEAWTNREREYAQSFENLNNTRIQQIQKIQQVSASRLKQLETLKLKNVAGMAELENSLKKQIKSKQAELEKLQTESAKMRQRYQQEKAFVEQEYNRSKALIEQQNNRAKTYLESQLKKVVGQSQKMQAYTQKMSLTLAQKDSQINQKTQQLLLVTKQKQSLQSKLELINNDVLKYQDLQAHCNTLNQKLILKEEQIKKILNESSSLTSMVTSLEEGMEIAQKYAEEKSSESQKLTGLVAELENSLSLKDKEREKLVKEWAVKEKELHIQISELMERCNKGIYRNGSEDKTAQIDLRVIKAIFLKYFDVSTSLENRFQTLETLCSILQISEKERQTLALYRKKMTEKELMDRNDQNKQKPIQQKLFSFFTSEQE